VSPRPCMTKAEKREWDRGFFARDAGESRSANPHTAPADRLLAKAWASGFETADATARPARLHFPHLGAIAE
jgi:hypothetical protein